MHAGSPSASVGANRLGGTLLWSVRTMSVYRVRRRVDPQCALYGLGRQPEPQGAARAQLWKSSNFWVTRSPSCWSAVRNAEASCSGTARSWSSSSRRFHIRRKRYDWPRHLVATQASRPCSSHSTASVSSASPRNASYGRRLPFATTSANLHDS
jgi:hypothetical protein